MGEVKVGTYKGQVEIMMYCHWKGDVNTASAYMSFTDEQIDELIRELIRELENAKSGK
jgi:hypothetical protein